MIFPNLFLVREMLVREVYEGALQAFVFVGDQGGYMKVREDFSPLSTNATCWKARNTQ